MEVAPFLTPAPGEDREAVRALLGFAEDDFVVGTVARLAQHKGHDDVLDAAKESLRPRGPWKLLWVGDGWWRGRLLERARGLGVHAHEMDKGEDRASLARAGLVLTGLVPPARIPAMMRAMDVLCHPSSREGLPRTVPQALLCGVCPVAYDADGTREACIEMRTGRLVRVGDVAGLGAALRWCHEHPRDRQTLAASGREMCAHAFSAEVMVAELEKVHARALGLARATAR
jgi:glycosyltransferase involved in cell wall biosynthesis